MGPFEALVHENYYGTYRDEYDYPGQLFSAKFTTDLELAYEAMKNVTVGIGGRKHLQRVPGQDRQQCDQHRLGLLGRPDRRRGLPAHRWPLRLQRRVLVRPGCS